METEKRQFLGYHSNGCYKEKNFFKNLNLIDSNHHWKSWVDWITVGWDKMSQPKKCKFLEKGNESTSITILHFMSTFHNFALRIQTGGATGVLKHNGTCLIRCKQITIKVDPEKNGFEVSKNSILYVFCYKICTL